MVRENAPSKTPDPALRAALLAFIDEIAVLAADLRFEGKLEGFPLEETSLDDDDD